MDTKLRKLLVVVLLSVLVIGPLHAQNGSLLGKVVDSQTNAPVEFANVVVRNAQTDSLVTGTVSDKSGSFRMNGVPLGSYVVECFFMGYEKKRLPKVTIDKRKSRADLGTIVLASTAFSMNEVTITGERTMMETQIDRKVFNVQKDIQAQTGTVSDVLQSIPAVAVDMDGNISLRGSGAVTILINGRPSMLATAANLDQMPANLIEKIEVITNPSAKYQPDGTAGIINIVLKKERKSGFNTIIGANGGNNNRFNTNLQMNYNTGRVNLFGSYGFRKDYRWRSSELTSQTIDTVTGNSVYLNQSEDGTARPTSHLGQLGADWTVTDRDIVGVSGSFNVRSVPRGNTTLNLYSNTLREPTEQFTRFHDGNEDEDNIGAKASYEHRFNNNEDHTLQVDIEYERDSETEDDYYKNVYQIPAYNDGNTRSLANNSEDNLNMAIGYSRPWGDDASVEAGYELTRQTSDQVQEISELDNSQQWVLNAEEGNLFYANQTVHAFYSTASVKFGKLSMLGGLRAEEALIHLEFRKLNATASSEYFSLYPTLHLALASGDDEWQLNYSRRVNRPDGEDMNPVPEYRDPRNRFVGNPNLKPENIHSVEMGYSVRHEKFTLVPALFYRYKVDGFAWVTRSVNDTVLESTIGNLATDQSAGIDLSGSWQVAKICNLNFSTSGYYSQIDASNLGYEANKSTFSWNARLNASINLTKTTMIQINSQFRSKELSAQGMREPSWVMNLGFRQDLWAKKLSFVATISDVFDTQKRRSFVDTDILVQESVRRRDGRVFYAGFVLYLGTNGKKQKDPKFEYDNSMER